MKRCTRTDKKILALVISAAMLATTFPYGASFAGEEASGSDAAATEAAETVETAPAGEQNGEGQTESEPAEEAQAEAEPEIPADEEEPAVTEPEKQTVTLVAVVNDTKRILLKPDGGNCMLPFTVKKARESSSFVLYVKNPEGCTVNLTAEKAASNVSDEIDFVEIEPISEEELDSAAANAMLAGFGEELAEGEQLSGFRGTVNGTGQTNVRFEAAGKEAAEETNAMEAVKGTITVIQTRPTTDMSKSASVVSKSVTPTAIKIAYKQKYTKIKIIKKKKKKKKKKVTAYRTAYRDFEIKTESGVSESGYGIVQGGGTDGTYSYSAITKKDSETYVKIVKTRLSDMKVVKTSADLKLNHANDVTYDPANDRLVVTHNAVNRKRVSFVNPSTLTVTGYKDIKVPATLKGATKEQLSDINGFASVTYMREGKYAGCYIAVISNYHNFLVLDSSFTPVEYISVAAKYDSDEVYYQGVDAVGDSLYVAVYPRNYSEKNMISVYDMDGEYKGTINLIKGFELENVYHAGSTFYVTIGKPVTKVWYTTKTVKKKVKVKKKGKIKYKYKKVKVKVKHTLKVKRSYIYKMGAVSF